MAFSSNNKILKSFNKQIFNILYDLRIIFIYLILQFQMKKKIQMLELLRKQVNLLKEKLQIIHKPTYNSYNYKNYSNPQKSNSKNYSSRSPFGNNNASKGVKQVHQKYQKISNITTLILKKSQQQKVKSISPVRIKQYNQTMQNFQTEPIQIVQKKYENKNKQVGKGYFTKREGVKRITPLYSQQKILSNKKHFSKSFI